MKTANHIPFRATPMGRAPTVSGNRPVPTPRPQGAIVLWLFYSAKKSVILVELPIFFVTFLGPGPISFHL